MYGATAHCSSSIAAFDAAREARQLAAAGVAQDVHEEQPVLRARVAEPEHRARARRAVDVRHAEGLVAHDRDVRARRVGALDVARRHAERAVLEVLGDVGGLQPRRRVDEVAVHRQLVAAVRDRRAGRQEGAELGSVVAPARAGRAGCCGSRPRRWPGRPAAPGPVTGTTPGGMTVGIGGSGSCAAALAPRSGGRRRPRRRAWTRRSRYPGNRRSIRAPCPRTCRRRAEQARAARPAATRRAARSPAL